MSRNVDKFFKDKLEKHSIPPAPQSWDKVEARISKKNNLAVVLRVAAAIAMVGLVVTVIINRNSGEHTQDVAVKHNKEEIAPATTKESEQTTTSADAPKQQATSSHSKKKNKITTPAKELTEKKIQPEATVDPQPVVLVTEEQLIAEVQPEPAKKKKMVLVYSLPTIAKSTGPVPEEDKRTGLQKVMDVAMEVKSGDNPLGDLRQVKDELFALDFRKDKDKSKNH